MLAEVFSFLKMLPELWALFKRLEKALGPDWVKKHTAFLDAYEKARKAESPDEYREAAKSISDAWTK